jgi:hypothetical protein
MEKYHLIYYYVLLNKRKNTKLPMATSFLFSLECESSHFAGGLSVHFTRLA